MGLQRPGFLLPSHNRLDCPSKLHSKLSELLGSYIIIRHA